jgi:16S rRNA (guanine527-N7)-methyltransferase
MRLRSGTDDRLRANVDDAAASELQGQAGRLGVALDPEQTLQLLEYERLLQTRGAALGLISADDAKRVRSRHTLDCLRAAATVQEGDSLAVDLGSGGGLPGIPVAVANPGLRIVLVESRRVRGAFLELAVEQLRLRNAEVRVARIEQLLIEADLCFARALAPLPRCWILAQPLLRPDGRLVYFAGAGSETLEAPPGGRLVGILSAPALASAGALAIIGRP